MAYLIDLSFSLELPYINLPSEGKAVIESGAFTSFATR